MSKTGKTELLAPAKDLATGIVAINSGADAVYIGASSFGARHSAGNNLEDIKKLVEYAHLFNVKVHVTINTILTDEELKTARDLIINLDKIGVDAIIVQDMGLINLAIKGEIPPIPLHASTQCNNRTLEKVKFLENIGFSRVILARELSLECIKDICENTDLEIETFIHGALCVSYSGQCYLSCYIGGRSANRGECAQPCRKKYSLVDDCGNYIAKDRHLLSMKDFNASDYLKNLVDYGVKSFKIEGRLKDINYVKNVVAYYRKNLDEISVKTSSGKVFHGFAPDVNKSFNRNFTSYFLKERERCFNFSTPKMVGECLGKVKKSALGWFELDKKCSVNPQDGICYFEADELKGSMVNKVESSKIFLNKKIILKPGTLIYRNYDYEFDKIISNAKTKRKIAVNIEYNNSILKVVDEDGYFVEYKISENQPSKNPQKMLENFKKQISKTGESFFYVENINIIDELPFIPVSGINEIRRYMLDNLVKIRLKNYKREKQPPLKYFKYINTYADYKENIHNKEAEDFYKKCNCLVNEYSVESSNKFKEKELMRTKHCLKYAFNLCKSPKKLYLIDEKGKKYKLKFDCKNCEMVIFEYTK